MLSRHERELDELLGDYFIHGSRLWWLLLPVRVVWQAVRPLLNVDTPLEVSAYQLAVELREEAADKSPDSVAYLQMITGPERHREGRTLAPA